ncbi:MAG: sigma-70 family RNA polymerase sigma factor [Holophagales bacterium]|nr:sigma-70 family RNA polymerase sigma factor [Holophagales bacterium]MXX60192.1 sigma-70 family RNA polymerase sigma factor [Holophagales bacterium]MYC11496.1 sigma-70 family RNA polymerase sigma factor [Holophagales bacterium]MYD20778.1 sigma-70 family RNA polymerase sigma factor [Holophagales bacterium]MYI33671.1 sigma-70 family RNA polymerase sigma factor [Holophagales bacterium]
MKAVEATRATDEELVAAILDGEAALYTDLVERYRGRLINYLNRFLGNVQESEELSQEVFLRVYRALDRYNPKYRFSTWLFRVAKNAAIDLIRKRRLKLVPMQRVGVDGKAHEREFESEERDPYRTLRNVERRQAIGAAIDGLKEEYRELIQLRHFAEMTYEEIAEFKGMPLGTVKNKLFRGRRMLKARLADYLTD